MELFGTPPHPVKCPSCGNEEVAVDVYIKGRIMRDPENPDEFTIAVDTDNDLDDMKVPEGSTGSCINCGLMEEIREFDPNNPTPRWRPPDSKRYGEGN